MKLQYLFLLILMLGFTSAFSGAGAGTAGDPYQITNWNELNETGDDVTANYLLVNNLDRTTAGYATTHGTNGWRPIPTFTGVFDGNGKTISDLRITRTSGGNQALFSVLNDAAAQIKDLALFNVSINASRITGGIVGQITSGIVNNTQVVQGFVASHAAGASEVGGLVGASGGTIINSFTTNVTVNANDQYGGGLLGEQFGGIITHSYSTNVVTNGSGVGAGLIGRLSGGPNKVNNSFWDFNSSGVTLSSFGLNGTGKNTTEMKTESTFTSAGWNFNNVWAIDPLINGGYPYLQSLVAASITVNSPENNKVVTQGNKSFNITATSSVGLANVSLYIDNVYNETINISGSTNTTVFYKNFGKSTIQYYFEVCDINNVCIFNTNRTLIIADYSENSITFNATSYETESEDFTLNLSITDGLTISNPKFYYNGTSSTATATQISSTEYSLTKTLGIGSSDVGNNTFYFEFTIDGVTNQSTTYYQNNTGVFMTYCLAGNTTSFLHYDFADEDTLASINASISSSTFNYWLGSEADAKTFSYTNSSEGKTWDFCISPANRTFNIDILFPYASSGYPQRVYDPLASKFTNTTTNNTLYLLATAQGQYVTFQVVNTADQPQSGVFANVSKVIGGSDTIISSGTTDNAGSVTFWLDPDSQYSFWFTKSGLTGSTFSLFPTQTAYTVTLGGGVTTANASFQGVDYTTNPTNTFLLNNTVYNFNFTMTSSFWDITTYGFNVRYANGTLVSGGTTGTEGTVLDVDVNTTNESILYMDYFWVINGQNFNGTKVFPIVNTQNTGWSIATFFTDFNSYIDSGIFGLDNFGRNLIVYLILFISVGVFSYKYGLQTPIIVSALTFAIVFFFDVVTNTIPTVRGIENLPTFLAGIILVMLLIREAQN